MINYDYKIDKKYNKIAIIGSGFSLDCFNWKIIDDNTLIIAVNNTACVVKEKIGRECDILVSNDIQSLRPIVLESININTPIIMARPFGHVIQCTDWHWKEGDKDILKTLSQQVFNHRIIFIYQYFEAEALKDPGIIITRAKEGKFFNTGNSGSMAFTLAYVLKKINKNIKRVLYVGIDTVQAIQEKERKYYAQCMEPYAFRKDKVLKPAIPYELKGDIFDACSFAMALLAPTDKRFYDSLECHSFYNITGLYPKMKRILNEVIDYSAHQSSLLKAFRYFDPGFCLQIIQKIK